MARKKALEKIESRLRDYAMSFPEATEDHPWGHIAVKVKKKAFVFLGGDQDESELSITVKLPSSRDMAADLPFAEPSGYGLGKSGWITARFAPDDHVPLETLRQWLLESYYAVAPKRVSDRLADPSTGDASVDRTTKAKTVTKTAAKTPAAKKAAAKKTVAKKPAAKKSAAKKSDRRST